MLNKKKFLIISVLAIFVVAMSLSAVSASSNKKTKSITFKIKKQQEIDYDLSNGDTISYVCEYRNNMGYPRGVTIETFKKHKSGGLIDSKHTKLVKATVWFKKKGKTIKKSSSKVKYYFIRINMVKGYKADKLKVWYKTK